ncbi:MAG: DUF7504 family protein [Thermoplasmata archaeon]
MSEPAEEAAESARTARETAAEMIGRRFGLEPGPALRLADSGHVTIEEVRDLTDTTLQEIGLSSEDIRRIRTTTEAGSAHPPPADRAVEDRAGPTPRPPADGEKIVERWMDSVRRTERPKRRHVPVAAKDAADVLRKWVQGDDRAMEAWIQSSDALRPPSAPAPPHAPAPAPPVVPAPATTSPVPASTAEAAPATAEVTAPAAGLLPAQLREREETVVRWLTELLDRVKSDQFEPASLLQEVQELHRQLYEEREKRKQLDDELEHVKRGSIAVIKYVRSREAKTREQAVQAKDAEIAELRLRLLTGSPDGEPRPAAETLADGDVTVAPAIAGSKVADPEAREIERRLRADFEERERSYLDREAELRRRIVQVESELRQLRGEAESVEERGKMLERSASELPATITDRLKEMESRERDLVRRESELRSKFEEIRIEADEVDRKRVPIASKESELAQWESRLEAMKQSLEVESRRLERARAEAEATGASPAAQDDVRKLEALRNEMLHRAADLKARESFVAQRTEELEALQRKLASGEAEGAPPPPEVVETKVKSGVRRLDDLMFGGFPLASQLLVNGPAHTGKDVLARLFVAEGLKAGIPAIWVVTDKTYGQIRDEMTLLYPTYAEAEARGLVRYVDLYARSVGITQAEPGVRLLSSTDKGILDQLTQAVNAYSAELKEKAPTYRLVFETVSTVTAYLDTTATFRFLQPFAGRRKIDGAASYYLLETGMHTESDLQTLEHMMDGSINLKVDQLKTFLSVRGISEAQSRAWVGYTFTKKAFTLGSFSLDHIR